MKEITIEAKTRSGERGFVTKLYPQNLTEAVELFGEKEVFAGFIRDRVIIDQREARPEKTANGSDVDQTPKKKRGVMHLLND